MFSTGNLFILVFAVLLSVAFIIASVHYVNKLIASNTKDLLVRFILLIFAALVGVFIVDKVIAFKTPLLSIEQNNSLFDLIKTLTLMIFSYYFGTQKGKGEKEEE
jgi:membrane protein YdbS with pleckstrin-like domain